MFRKQPNKSLTDHCFSKSSGPSSWSWTYAVERHSFDGDWIHWRHVLFRDSGEVSKKGKYFLCIKVHLSICIYIFLFIDAPNVFLAMWGNWLATVKQWFTCPALFTNFPEIVLKLLDLKPVNLRKKVRMKQDLCWSPLFVIQYPLQPCYVCKLWPVDHEALPALHHPHQNYVAPTWCWISGLLFTHLFLIGRHGTGSLTVGEAPEVHHADVYRIGDLFIFSLLEFWSHGKFDVWNMFL